MNKVRATLVYEALGDLIATGGGRAEHESG